MNDGTLLSRLAEEFGFSPAQAWARELTGVDPNISNGYSLIGTYVDRNRPYLRQPGERALFLVSDGGNPKTYGLAELQYSGYVSALENQSGNRLTTVADHQLWAREFHKAIESWMAGPEVNAVSHVTTPVDPTYDPSVLRHGVLLAAVAAMTRR
jgi:hypothetical protein